MYRVAIALVLGCGGGSAATPIAPVNASPQPAPFVVTLGEATVVVEDQDALRLSADGTINTFADKPRGTRWVLLADGTIELWLVYHAKSDTPPPPNRESAMVMKMAKLTQTGALRASEWSVGEPQRFDESLPIEFSGTAATTSITSRVRVTLQSDGTLEFDPPRPETRVRIVATDPQVRATMFRLFLVFPLAIYQNSIISH